MRLVQSFLCRVFSLSARWVTRSGFPKNCGASDSTAVIGRNLEGELHKVFVSYFVTGVCLSEEDVIVVISATRS